MPMGQDQGPGPYSGSELESLKGWLANPQKLLRGVTGTAAAHAGPLHRDSVDTRLQEEDVLTLVRRAAPAALVSRQVKDEAEATVLTGFFRQRLQNLPVDLVVTLERILGQLAGGEPAGAPPRGPPPAGGTLRAALLAAGGRSLPARRGFSEQRPRAARAAERRDRHPASHPGRAGGRRLWRPPGDGILGHAARAGGAPGPNQRRRLRRPPAGG